MASIKNLAVLALGSLVSAQEDELLLNRHQVSDEITRDDGIEKL
jgi:hypothetical protein